MTKNEASKDVLRLKQLIDSAVEVMPRLTSRDQDAQAASIFIGSRNHSIPEALILDTSLSLEERALYQIMLIKTLKTGSSAAILYSRDIIQVSAVSSPKTLRKYQYALRLTRWITRAAQARDRGIVWAISDEPLSLADTLVLDPCYLDFVNSLLMGSDRRLRMLAEGIAQSINGDLLEGRHPFTAPSKLERAAAELDRQTDQALTMQHRVYAVDTTLEQAQAANTTFSETVPTEVGTKAKGRSKGLGKFYLTPVSSKQVGQNLPNPPVNEINDVVDSTKEGKLSTYPQASRQKIPVGGKFYPTLRSSSLYINNKNKTTTKDGNSSAVKNSSSTETAAKDFQTRWLENFAAKEQPLANPQGIPPSSVVEPVHRLEIDLAQFPGAQRQPATPVNEPRKPAPERETPVEVTPVYELKKLTWPSGLTESETAGFLRILKTHPLEEAAHLLEYYRARQRKVSEGLKPLGNKVAWLNQISIRIKNGEYLANNWVKEASAPTTVAPTPPTQPSLHQSHVITTASETPSSSAAASHSATAGKTAVPRSTTSLKKAMESLNASRTLLNPVN